MQLLERARAALAWAQAFWVGAKPTSPAGQLNADDHSGAARTFLLVFLAGGLPAAIDWLASTGFMLPLVGVAGVIYVADLMRRKLKPYADLIPLPRTDIAATLQGMTHVTIRSDGQEVSATAPAHVKPGPLELLGLRHDPPLLRLPYYPDPAHADDPANPDGGVRQVFDDCPGDPQRP